jgi:thiamine-phosphate pyrophosphorylase
VILCLVTDRRRADVVEQARRAIEAGIDFIQIRERDLDAARLSALVEQTVRVTRGSRTRVVVNDRLDVALACGADGVHLRADSVSPARARALAPAGFLVGRSVHQVAEAIAAAADVDYLIAGTVFPTSSKPSSHPLLGTDGLAAIVRGVSVPVLAIGGVTADRIGRVSETGAAGVAAIGLFLDVDSLAAAARNARERFDSVKTGS